MPIGTTTEYAGIRQGDREKLSSPVAEFAKTQSALNSCHGESFLNSCEFSYWYSLLARLPQKSHDFCYWKNGAEVRFHEKATFNSDETKEAA